MEKPSLIQAYESFNKEIIILEKEKDEIEDLEKKEKLIYSPLIDFKTYVGAVISFILSFSLFMAIGGSSENANATAFLITLSIALFLNIAFLPTNKRLDHFLNKHNLDDFFYIITILMFIFIINAIVLFFLCITLVVDLFLYLKFKILNKKIENKKGKLSIIENKLKIYEEERAKLFEEIKKSDESLLYINKLDESDKLKKRITLILEMEYKQINIIEHHIKNKNKQIIENL